MITGYWTSGRTRTVDREMISVFHSLAEWKKSFVPMVKQDPEVTVPIDEVLIAIALLIDVRGQSRVFDRMPTLQGLWMRNQERVRWLIGYRRLGREPFDAPTEVSPTFDAAVKQ